MNGSRLVLALSAAVITGCVAAWSVSGDQTGRIAGHLALYGTAFLAYLVSIWAARGLSSRGLVICLGLGLAWRTVLVAAPPLLSDDVYRYVWEGRIQLHDGNPYAWSDRPEAPRWTAIRDPIWERVNHKDYTAIYPPFWQLAARGVVGLSDSVPAMKAFLVSCEVLALWVLWGMIRRRRLPHERLLIAAWSPLALVEVAGSGHNEPLGVLLLLIAVWALEAGRPGRSALAATLAFQAKLLPGVVALAWARRYRPRHVAAALLVAVALVLPYASAGGGLVRSLSKYAQLWRFNETLFAPLAWLVGDHAMAVRAAAGLVVLLAAGLAWRRVEPTAGALAVLTAWILLNPSMLPWYALWLPPLLVLRDAPPLMLFTGTVGLAYLVYPGWQSDGVWQVGWGIRALEYAPCLALAVRPLAVHVSKLWGARA